jgi:membrane protein
MTAESSRDPSDLAEGEAAPSPTSSPGATAESPLHLPKAAWIQVVKRVWTMAGLHELGLLSAGVAFYVFLAMTPLIAATVMIYGLVGDVQAVRDQMQRIVEVVPADAARLIEDQLLCAVTTSKGVVGIALVVALAFAIYGGMRAASGLMSALNIINEERETRGFVTLSLRAVLLTLAAVAIALIGLLSGGIFAWLQTQTTVFLGEWTSFLFKLLTWVLAVALGSAGFALVMRYGPDRRPAKWRWLIPGSLLSTLLWIVVSFGFSLYVAYVSDYNATYGSLSAMVVFLMWLFLSAYGVLLGALLNAEIERQTVCDTTAGPAMPMGERGAVLADLAEGNLSMGQILEKRARREARRNRRKLASS